MTDFEGYDTALRLIEHNKSLRMVRLEKLGAWVTGHQYDGRASWWDDDSGKPLWERAPCIVYPVVGITIASNSDLMLGEGRFPQFTFKPGEDSAEDENGLSESDSEVADETLEEYHKLSRFRSHCRESFESAQGCGTSVSIHGVRNGRPFVDSMPAKWCEVETNADGAVTKLVIQYPYLSTFRNKFGKWACKAMLYRREIDEQKDTTFQPAECTEAGPDQITWKPDASKTYVHGFGFCPVIWYTHMRGSAAVNVVDGNAVHADYLDEIQAHDIALSQKHRGALFSEPQICEIGVRPGFSPTALGRKALVPASVGGGELSATNPPKGAYLDSHSDMADARKKGPGYVWQYPNETTKVQVLCYPPEALKAQDDNARDLRMKLMESMGIVLLDPESIKFAATTSGKALETIKQRQLDRCDTYRNDFEGNFLEPSIAMQLRIIRKLGDKMRLAGGAQFAKLLGKFDTAEGWVPPAFQVRWGDYFKPDPEDQNKIVTLTAMAFKANLITLQVAVEKLKAIFGIENVSEIVDQLEQAKEEAKAEMAEALAGKQDPENPDETAAETKPGTETP